MQRRRSYDAVDDTNTRQRVTKPSPTPLSSISARVNQPSSSRQRDTSAPKINNAAIPFPRGGRQIGQSNNENNNSIPDSLLRRSNSIERNNRITEGKLFTINNKNKSPKTLNIDQQPKKRHLFRFGKRKSNISGNIVDIYLLYMF
jgi:hypothetical protein